MRAAMRAGRAPTLPARRVQDCGRPGLSPTARMNHPTAALHAKVNLRRLHTASNGRCQNRKSRQKGGITMVQGLAAAAAFVALASAGHAAADAAARARFSVNVDTSAAEAMLAAATSDPVRAADEADAALRLPTVLALIAKEHKYNAAASAETFRADVIAVANGAPARVFPLQPLHDNPAPSRSMLELIRAQRGELAARLGEGLRAFAPDGVTIEATLAIVLGSHQHGWVADQKATVLYVDAGRHLGDVEGLLALSAHELFHVIQGALQPDWGPMFAAAPATWPAQKRIAHNVHAALTNLVIEGMADYVGDPEAWGANRPGFDRDRREYARELARSQETFALFDTIVYRFAHDEDAPLDLLLTIGFGGSWDQTGYYVGYAMAKAIDHHLGRVRLRALVALPPEAFVSDYIAVARDHAHARDITPLAPSTIATVAAIARETANGSP
jgi:hypothetical protein